MAATTTLVDPGYLLDRVFDAPPEKTPLSRVVQAAVQATYLPGAYVKILNHTGMLRTYYLSTGGIPAALVYVKHPNCDLWYQYSKGLPQERCKVANVLHTESNLFQRLTTIFRQPPAFRILIVGPDRSVVAFNRDQVNLRA